MVVQKDNAGAQAIENVPGIATKSSVIVGMAACSAAADRLVYRRGRIVFCCT